MSSLLAQDKIQFQRRVAGDNVWLARTDGDRKTNFTTHPLKYEALESEEAVGRAMLDEIEAAAREKDGDLTIVIVGGRGGQALHRLVGELSETDKLDHLLGRLNIYTQDALAPM